MNPELIAECIGVVGFTATVISFQCKKRRNILWFQLLSTSCWTLHYCLLGAFAGAGLNIVGVLRCLVFAWRGEEGTRRGRIADWAGWVPVFIALSAAATLLTWNGWLGLLPFCGMILTTFATRADTARMVRLLTLPNDPLWLIYNAASGSISGVITEVCIICSILIGMLRHDLRRDTPHNENQ